MFGSRTTPITDGALDRVVAQLNIDMIGRNRDDKASESQHRVPRRVRPHQH